MSGLIWVRVDSNVIATPRQRASKSVRVRRRACGEPWPMSFREFKIGVPSRRRDHGCEGRPKAREMAIAKQDRHDSGTSVKPHFFLDLEW